MHRQTPVLLLTGHQRYEKKLCELGACGALPKMLDLEVLLEEVRRYI